MTTPHPQRPIHRRGHLYLVPPLSEAEAATSTPSKPATFPWDVPATTPYGQPWAGRPAYVHTIPQTMPSDDHHDHPPRRRVQWDRSAADQETRS